MLGYTIQKYDDSSKVPYGEHFQLSPVQLIPCPFYALNSPWQAMMNILLYSRPRQMTTLTNKLLYIKTNGNTRPECGTTINMESAHCY